MELYVAKSKGKLQQFENFTVTENNWQSKVQEKKLI